MDSTPLKPDPKLAPSTTPRRSLRRLSTCPDPKTPQSTPRSARKPKPKSGPANPRPPPPSFSPVTPSTKEPKKRSRSVEPRVKVSEPPKKQKRVYYRKVVYDGGEFAIGDDVYVKRKEGADSDDEDPEMEECRICFEAGRSLMIECDDCLGGFHLRCLKPPLRKVPDGDWACGFCVAIREGRAVEMPRPPEGKRVRRTAKERLLSSDLWAARIERLWKEPDGNYWMRCRWYMIPEETSVGRQSHNLRRELYRTNHSSDVEMESVIRHCYVMNPKEYSEASNGGDDVFYCEYEYDVHWHSFKRIADIADDDDNDEGAGNDEDWKISKDSGCTDEDSECEEDTAIDSTPHKYSNHELAANSRKGRIFGIHKIGIKKIPEHVRRHKQSELERAKATLLLATLPKSLPCRNKEMEEISAFIKGAICDDHCFGRCLYIHGVPGTGKAYYECTFCLEES
ncbi:origin of replication complex subunit 1-like [Iris pallida]|uniref:Origin recognition complex subunit 1 n=1 Tax=Iris pallida TaxID=29817 RepID=A0AAX6F5V9_IRIPA|nr:origin of replication complex subunit 1-like [Iris pallida]